MAEGKNATEIRYDVLTKAIDKLDRSFGGFKKDMYETVNGHNDRLIRVETTVGIGKWILVALLLGILIPAGYFILELILKNAIGIP